MRTFEIKGQISPSRFQTTCSFTIAWVLDPYKEDPECDEYHDNYRKKSCKQTLLKTISRNRNSILKEANMGVKRCFFFSRLDPELRGCKPNKPRILLAVQMLIPYLDTRICRANFFCRAFIILSSSNFTRLNTIW